MFSWLAEMLKKIFFIEGERMETIQGLDHQKIARKLKIRNTARAMAKNNLPAQDDQSTPHPEKAAAIYYRQEMLRYQDIFQKKVSQYRQALLGEEHRVNFFEDIKAMPERFAEELETRRRRDLNAVDDLTKELRWNEENLAMFKEKNGIDPDAVPDRKSVGRVTLIFLVIAVLVELTFNLLLFAPALRGLSGVFLCIFITAVNGLATFYCGRWTRLLWLKSRWNKLAGILAVAFFTAILVPFNFLVAHIRELAMEMGGMNSRQILELHAMLLKKAFSSLVESPLDNILTLEGMGLLLIGMTVAALSYWEGWRTKERYPGFADRYNSVIETREQLIRTKNNVQLNSIRLREQRERDLQEAINTLRSDIARQIDRYRNFLSLAGEHLSNYRLMQEDCCGGYEYAVRLFRDENLMHRPDRKKPVRFSMDPEAIALPDLGFELHREEATLLSLEQQKKEMEPLYRQLVQEMEKVWAQHANTSKTAVIRLVADHELSESELSLKSEREPYQEVVAC